MSLNKPTGNPPQIYKIEYALVSDVASVIIAKTFAAVVALKSGKSWNSLYSTYSSIAYTEAAGDSDAGPVFNQQLQVQYPGTDPLAQDVITRLERFPIIALIYYQDGTIRVLGSIAQPAIMKADFESGNRTGFTLQINCASTERSRFLYADLASVP